MANMPKFSLSEKARKRAEKIRSTKAAATPQMETSAKPPKVNKPEFELSQPKPKVETPKPEAPKQIETPGKGRVKATKAQLEERATTRKVRSRVEIRSRAAAAKQIKEGGITKPKPKGVRERLRIRTKTPKPTSISTVSKGPGLGARISEKLRLPEALQYKTGGTATYMSRGTSFLGKAVRRVAPGVGAGLALGSAVGGDKYGAEIGAGAGAIASAIAPRLIAKTALPLAAATSAVDIGRATYHGVKAAQAASHVKTHAQAAKKAGYRVTRRHPILGAITGTADIKLQKVSEGQYTPGVAPPWARKKGKK